MKRLIVAAVAIAVLAGQAQAAAPKKDHAGAPASAKGWVYKDVKNEMGESRHVACVLSDDQAKLDFPYHPTKAHLCVETRPLGSQQIFSVYVALVDKGQILFDEGAQFKFADGSFLSSGGYESSTPSGDTILLKKGPLIIRSLLHSPSAVVGLHFYQNGEQFLHFYTANLKFPNPGLDPTEIESRNDELRKAGRNAALTAAVNARYDCLAQGRQDCPAVKFPDRKRLSNGMMASGPGGWNVNESSTSFYADLEADQDVPGRSGPDRPQLGFSCSNHQFQTHITWSGMDSSTVTYQLDGKPPQTWTWKTIMLLEDGPEAQRWFETLVGGQKLTLRVEANKTRQEATFDLTGIDEVASGLKRGCGG